MIRLFTILILCAATNRAVAETVRPDFSNAAPIHLVHGVNHIPDFDGRGHPGEIVYAWRENMNAHSYGMFSVLMLRPDTTDDWNLVTFETHEEQRKGGSEIDSVTDNPFDGEQIIASVRFVKAMWKDQPATIAITAARDTSKSMSFVDSGRVEFSIYRLVANEDGIIGWPFYYFDRVEHFKTIKQYCNADLALAKELHLPLPENYAGPRNEDGCIR